MNLIQEIALLTNKTDDMTHGGEQMELKTHNSGQQIEMTTHNRKANK